MSNEDIRHVWHPFTQMAEYARLPRLSIERGEGNWLIGTDGRRYLDASASIWTNTFGHTDPDLKAALMGQLDKLAHSTSLGLGNPATQRLAAHLAKLAPGSLSRVFFSDNGSGAVEVALKLSFQYWQLAGQPQKQRVLAMQGAYHGDTFGTMSVGGSDGFHGRFQPWLFPVDRFPAPVHEAAGGRVIRSNMEASLAAIKAHLQAHATTTACLILEPWVQGAAGMRLQPRGFVTKVAELCHQYGVHLILDEVFVGFGRMGTMLCCAEEGVQPDFLCLAKGLAAGWLPLAATMTTDAIYERFLGEVDSGHAFYHGHTFTGNPLACAVAEKNLQKLEGLLEAGTLQATVETFTSLVAERILGHRCFPVVRQMGLCAALELPGGFAVNDRLGMQVAIAARALGIVIRPLADTLLVVPPLSILPHEQAFLFEGLIQAAEQVLKNPRLS
jgi:adenosylmethionine-8-amino-7-oxononanoate aminotransferase